MKALGKVFSRTNTRRALRHGAFLGLLAGLPIGAQSLSISGLLQIWDTQMTDASLRSNPAPLPYYRLRGEFQENGFSIRRSEVHLKLPVLPNIYGYVVMDPAQPTLLINAFINVLSPSGFEVRVGQFRAFQTYEGVLPSKELLLAERSQLARNFGDVGERGVALGYGFPALGRFKPKAWLGLFNGSGKSNDDNAQKDGVARLEFTEGTRQIFGVYGLSGSTDLRDAGQLQARAFPGAGLAPAAVLAAKDRTTNLGAFYAFKGETWLASFEALGGRLGRRFPSLYVSTPGSAGAPPPALREHLDQRFLGLEATGGYCLDRHTFLLRYDLLDYNWGQRWTTPASPYLRTFNGRVVDLSPRYREVTFGYVYALDPSDYRRANLKLNYIARSRNFLAPRPDQSGAQGGDTFVAVLQVGF